MKDAIVFSSWGWDTFNVPERVALALASRGFRVLYCEMPVSRFRQRETGMREVAPGVHAFIPEYLGAKFAGVPILGEAQWKTVARQIRDQASALGLTNSIFLYSHVEGLESLCREMRAQGSKLVHICMDFPEPYQYELISISDRTLVIPPTVFVKLRAKYGDKILRIPQSIHLHAAVGSKSIAPAQELASIPSPRLGYLGPVYARLNLPLARDVLSAHPEWHFVCFGDTSALPLANVHGIEWKRPEELPRFVASFDVGVMPYDCFDEKNLHCVPLKLFDYFLAGLPVVSTPVLSLTEFSDLIYFGDTPASFARAIESALAEPLTSPNRSRRTQVALAHSTEALGERLDEVLDFSAPGGRVAM
jgi:Glycosyl transferases group 1